jgi:hypothetical protein
LFGRNVLGIRRRHSVLRWVYSDTQMYAISIPTALDAITSLIPPTPRRCASDWPVSPSHFNSSVRTFLADGRDGKGADTFREPQGLDASILRRALPCVSISPTSSSMPSCLDVLLTPLVPSHGTNCELFWEPMPLTALIEALSWRIRWGLEWCMLCLLSRSVLDSECCFAWLLLHYGTRERSKVIGG